MAIEAFLNEYRDYLYQKNTVLDAITPQSSRSDIYVLVNNAIKILSELYQNMIYLDLNLIDIEKEIKDIYNNIDKKLDKIERIAEGYQNLNTNELIGDTISSFRIFEIKDRSIYDTYFKGLSLPRITEGKNIITNNIIRNNEDGIETYKLNNNKNLYAKLNILDSNNTDLFKIITYDKSNNILNTLSNKDLIEITPQVIKLEVHTKNIDSIRSNYTSLDLLDNVFIQQSTISLDEVTFDKTGHLFKLNIDYDLPTECYCTLDINFKYIDTYSKRNINETVYINLNNNQEIILTKSKAKGIVKDLYGNILDYNSLSEDELILTNNYSTNDSIIKYLNTKVFDISNIRAEEFSVLITINMYSLTDKNKTPLIKGIFGYVTD